MLTHDEWKKQLQEVDKRYVEHNKPNKPIFSDNPNLALNRLKSDELIEEINNIIDASRYEQTVDSMEIARDVINAVHRRGV